MKTKSYLDFPLLFERVGNFLYALRELREQKPTSTKILEKYAELVQGSSPSPLDDAIAAFDGITNTIYSSRRECLGAGPLMRG
jgi:hypothetical protein